MDSSQEYKVLAHLDRLFGEFVPILQLYLKGLFRFLTAVSTVRGAIRA
jgi:hypothetical protein